MTQPNRDLDQAAYMLANIVAYQVTAALEVIHKQLATLDGFGERGDQVNVRASSELTSVERAADSRWRLTEQREALRDLKSDVLASIRDLNQFANDVIRMNTPKVVVKPEDKLKDCCARGQQGLDGAIEWGDPLCVMPGVKKGMCQSHYYKFYRWAKEHGVDRTNKDFEPA